MRKYIFTIILLLIAVQIFADEIHLKDKKVIQCKIIQIFQETIEYIENDSPKSKTISHDLVSKVVYDNKSEIKFFNRGKSGVIVLKNNRAIISDNINEKDSRVEYIPDKENYRVSIAKSEIKEIYIGKEKKEKFKRYYERNRDFFRSKPDIDPYNEFLKKKENFKNYQHLNYYHSHFKLSVFAGAGSFSNNELMENEKKLYREKKLELIGNDPYSNSHFNKDLSFTGFEFDLMTSLSKEKKLESFGYSGMTFGIKGRYSSNTVKEDMWIDNLRDIHQDGSGDLLTYSLWEAGPLINFVFFFPNDGVNFIFQIYMTCGYITGGKLRAAAALRDSGEPYSQSDYSTDINGYTINYGFGLSMTLGNIAPIIVGFNICIRNSKYKLDSDLPIYSDMDREFKSRDGSIEISAGVHF